MDTEIRQAIGSVSLERSSSPLMHVMSCRHRNVLFCLHENGSVSMRIHQSTHLPTSLSTSTLEPQVYTYWRTSARHPTTHTPHSIPFPLPPSVSLFSRSLSLSLCVPLSLLSLPLSQVASVTYTPCCLSEALRISKLCTVFSGTLCPTSEKRVAVMTSEGRILLWDVEFEQVRTHACARINDILSASESSFCHMRQEIPSSSIGGFLRTSVPRRHFSSVSSLCLPCGAWSCGPAWGGGPRGADRETHPC